MSNILISLDSIHRDYWVREGFFSVKRKKIRAIDHVSLDLRKNEILGLVGESGCGKSTLARITLGLEEPDSGSVFFQGKDISRLGRTEYRAFRQKAQMIFQDPFSSLNPKKTIFNTIREPLKIHGLCPAGNYRDRVVKLLADAGLSEPGVEQRYPHEFSGGQRQRICLARALATGPELIVADEPTSALDVSIQAQIINLLLDLQEIRGLSFLFISHDLPIIQFISHRVAVMYRGQLMELMRGGNFLECSDREGCTALHPYTRYLLSAILIPDPDLRPATGQPDTVAMEPDTPSVSGVTHGNGCAFASRCSRATKKCFEVRPEWKQVGEDHFLACHRES